MKTISIIGKTNVGKSSIFNALTKSKHAIITKKKNTTVEIEISKIILFDTEIIKLLDTPGPILKYNYKLKKINKNIYNAIKQSATIIFVISNTILSHDDFFLLELIKNKKKMLIFNNIKKKNYSILNKKLNQKSVFYKTSVIPQGDIKNINNLFFNNNSVKKIEHVVQYKTKILSIVRETLLKLLQAEIPYSIIINCNNIQINTEETLYLSFFIEKTITKKSLLVKMEKKLNL